MRKPSAAAILSVLLACSWIGFLANSPRAQEAAEPEVQRWEYQEVHDFGSAQHLGTKGWEAFSVVKDERRREFFLKRPKQ